MSLRYLLDTNVLSEPLAARPNAGVMKQIRRHQLHIATASVVWNELVFGTERLPPSKRRDTLQAYINEALRPALPILPYDAAAAEWHGLERARLERDGVSRPFIDGQIAAIAHTNGLIVVTANVKDFHFFDALVVENWRA